MQAWPRTLGVGLADSVRLPTLARPGHGAAPRLDLALGGGLRDRRRLDDDDVASRAGKRESVNVRLTAEHEASG
jgi:hypothetical protein